MIADLALHQVGLQHTNGRLLGGAGLLADATAGTGIAVYQRYEHRVLADTARVMLDADRMALQRAFAEADFTAQSLPGQAVLDIDDGQSHACIVDVLQGVVERAGRTHRYAGDILAHVTGGLARDEIGCADGDAGSRRCQFQGVIGAGTHTLAALDAGGVEVRFGQRTRWADGEWCRPGLLRQQV